MAVTITNVGARSIWWQGKKVNYGGWTTNNQMQVGNSGSGVSYAIQLHFRLDKPCTSIKLYVMGNGNGYVYFKASDNPADEEMLTRMLTEGNEPDAIPAYMGQTIEIKGNFPANTDLYIYGSNYATWQNTITVYSYNTKVTEAEELQGSVRVGGELHQCYIKGENGLELYLPYVKENGELKLIAG